MRWRVAGDKWGHLDRSGAPVVPPVYDCTWDFSEGPARVQVGDKWAFIDKAGVMVIAPERYSVVTDFSGGLASATKREGEEVYEVYFDRTGRVVWRAKL